MAAAALVSAGACLAARRAVPWQGRQAAVAMAVGMLVVATGRTGPLGALLVGALLLVSGMIGTMGVRGAASAATCCHRALGSLVMALCAIHGAGGSTGPGSAPAGHAGHGFAGALGALVLLGTLGIVAWTVVTTLRPAAHLGRAARPLAVESWAMAIGVVAMSVGG